MIDIDGALLLAYQQPLLQPCVPILEKQMFSNSDQQIMTCWALRSFQLKLA